MGFSSSMIDGDIGSWGSWNSQLSEMFPDPFMDMASLSMPETMQYALRWCWLPGTLIELSDHSYKKIEDIRPGDLVITKLGTIEKVINIGKRKVNEEILNIVLSGFGKRVPLRLTNNHKLPSICTTKAKSYKIDPWKYEIKARKACDLKVGDYLYAPIPVISDNFTPYSGWLLGMYIAEGNPIFNDKQEMSGTKFTLGYDYLLYDDEEIGILQKLVKITSDEVGNQQYVYRPQCRPDLRLLVVNDPYLTSWLVEHGGHYATKKKLSKEVFSFNEEFLFYMLAGWMDGDGYLKIDRGKFAGICGTTSSYVLAFQMMRIAQMLGFNPSISLAKNEKSGFAHTNRIKKEGYKDSYELRFSKQESLKFVSASLKLKNYLNNGGKIEIKQNKSKSHIVHNQKSYHRIVEINKEHYSGYVYNFEVENEHSYVANFISSANCEFIFISNGIYRQATDRVLSYFITPLEFADLGDDEEEKWKEFLDEKLDIRNFLHIAGLDAMCYGNAFISVLPRFKRYLACQNCKNFEAPLKVIYEGKSTFDFKWTDFQFYATCPKCKYRGKWQRIDRRIGEEEPIRLKRWNPHEMELLWDPLTDECAYIWKIPEDYRKKIREGHLYHLERANWEIIQAVKNNNYILFDKDVIYHMREDALAGVRNRGWGISRVLSNFRQAWYVQVLHRYNEAIALDYVIPFRLLTPVPGDKGTGTDPLLNHDMGGFMATVHQMVRKRRRDPASWHALPFPVQYQALGGDATQLAPRELLDQGIDTLLNSIGVPAEFYKGTLQLQAAPAALRLFESIWSTLPHNLNGLIRFIVKRISQFLNWEPITAKLMKVTHADDLQRQQSKLQLMMGGQISQTTGLKSVGVDYRDEVQRMMDDQRFQAEEQAKLQKEMQQSAQMEQMAQPMPQGGGQPPQQGGGQPMPSDPNAAGGAAGMAYQSVVANLPTGPNQQTTPEELLARADYVATQIMGMPESQKDSELIKLKKVDATLHALVTSRIKDYRQQAKTQGGAMMMAQMFGKQGSVKVGKLIVPRSLLRPRKIILPDE